MKITQDKLKELKQLDRIEFRQRYKELEDSKSESGVFDFMWKMFVLLGFMMIIVVMFITSGHTKQGITVILLIPLIIKIILLAILLLFALDIAYLITYIKRRNKLIEEYFEQQIKIRKK